MPSTHVWLADLIDGKQAVDVAVVEEKDLRSGRKMDIFSEWLAVGKRVH